LKDGSLPCAAFEHYVTQDAFYLRRHVAANSP
jgi:thiaminase